MKDSSNKILPVGPLMKEHRLIERMIALLMREAKNLESGADLDAGFIKEAVDFMKTYADECHHGKEENILFRELAKKQLAQEHAGIMSQLVADHKYGRKTVKKFAEANALYEKGDKNARSEVLACLQALVKLYPQHIEKEDKRFFLPCMSYFNDKERDAMLAEFREFDQGLIHNKYRVKVEEREKVK